MPWAVLSCGPLVLKLPAIGECPSVIFGGSRKRAQGTKSSLESLGGENAKMARIKNSSQVHQISNFKDTGWSWSVIGPGAIRVPAAPKPEMTHGVSGNDPRGEWE